MSRRFRCRFSGPPALRRAAWALFAAAVGLTFVSGWLSHSSHARTVTGSRSALIHIVIVLVVIASVACEGRLADLIGDFASAPFRRGSILRVVGGFMLLLPGCVLSAAIADRSAPGWANAVAQSGVVAGLSLVLSGLIRLAMVDGARYAADKLQERLDDDF